MPKFDLGKFKLTPRGEYNAETAYEALDVITYNYSSYLVLKDVTGIEPSDDGVNYQLLSGGVNPEELSKKENKLAAGNAIIISEVENNGEKRTVVSVDGNSVVGINQYNSDLSKITNDIENNRSGIAGNSEDIEKLKTEKADKRKVVLIRNFTVGNETTYQDNDTYAFSDEEATLTTSVTLNCDNNGEQMRLREAYILFSFPKRTDVTGVSYPINVVEYSRILNSSGYAGTNGYQLLHGYFNINSSYTYQVRQILRYDDEMNFKQGYQTAPATSGDKSDTLQLWQYSLALTQSTDWGTSEMKNGMTSIVINLPSGTPSSITSLPDGMEVKIYGVRM